MCVVIFPSPWDRGHFGVLAPAGTACTLSGLRHYFGWAVAGSTLDRSGPGELRGKLGSVSSFASPPPSRLQEGTCSKGDPGKLGCRKQICRSGGWVEGKVSGVSKVCASLRWEQVCKGGMTGRGMSTGECRGQVSC